MDESVQTRKKWKIWLLLWLVIVTCGLVFLILKKRKKKEKPEQIRVVKEPVVIKRETRVEVPVKEYEQVYDVFSVPGRMKNTVNKTVTVLIQKCKKLGRLIMDTLTFKLPEEDKYSWKNIFYKFGLVMSPIIILTFMMLSWHPVWRTGYMTMTKARVASVDELKASQGLTSLIVCGHDVTCKVNWVIGDEVHVVFNEPVSLSSKLMSPDEEGMPGDSSFSEAKTGYTLALNANYVFRYIEEDASVYLFDMCIARPDRKTP